MGGFGWDDGDVTLAAGAEGSAAGTVAVCVGVSCGSGGVVRTLPGGTMLGGTLLGGTTAVGTFPAGTGSLAERDWYRRLKAPERWGAGREK